MPVDRSDVTKLLKAWSAGDQEALDRLVPVVHDELRRLASRYMRREHNRRTLQTSALVNEAYLKLVDVGGLEWQDRTHFFAVSARIMRRILVDAARARTADKRGGGAVHVELEGVADVGLAQADEMLAIDRALERLAATDPRKERIVEMRFFSGLSVKETASALAISEQSVLRDWRLAKAWLLRELGDE